MQKMQNQQRRKEASIPASVAEILSPVETGRSTPVPTVPTTSTIPTASAAGGGVKKKKQKKKK